MRKVTLTRSETSMEGTFGTLVTDTGYRCRTGELPWWNNAQRESCIPAGVYVCRWILSPKFGWCYEVTGVPGRGNILIHVANFVGEKDLSLESQVLGCIALGKKVAQMNGQKALISSQAALEAFVDEMKKEAFELAIRWVVGLP